MTFQDIKNGGAVYVYDRSNITLSTEIVESVTPPHVEPVLGMVVDVVMNGTPYRFKATQEVGYNSPFVYSPDRERIIREIENHRSSNEALIAKTDMLKEENLKIEALINTLTNSQ